MLIPVLGFADIAFMEYSPVANHYAHLAIIGVVGLAAAGWSQWHQASRGPALAAAALVVGALGGLTWRQNRIFENVETLYRTTLEENPGSWVAHGNLGGLLANSGRLPEAIPHFVEALRLKPDYPQARVSLGSALASEGPDGRGEGAVRGGPPPSPRFLRMAHYNLALILEATGQAAGSDPAASRRPCGCGPILPRPTTISASPWPRRAAWPRPFRISGRR